MGCSNSKEEATIPVETRRVPDAKPATPQPSPPPTGQRAFGGTPTLAPRTPVQPPPHPEPSSPLAQRSTSASFVAFVVSDFYAELPNELSVKQGEFVLVEPVAGLPEGWCMVSLSQPGQPKRAGLVPWQFLVSSAHANQAVVPAPARERVMLEFKISRGRNGALGLDLDEENQVRRIAEGSTANGQLEVGDLVLAVDGKSLEDGMSILDVLDPSRDTYTFSVYRRELDPSVKDAYSAGIMDTMRLQEVGESSTIKYYSAPGRQVDASGSGKLGVRSSADSAESVRSSERSIAPDGLPANFVSPTHQVQQGARMTRYERVVKVRRTGTRLGIDINERNVIVKLIPGSFAHSDGLLREGDVVMAVDGEPLEGRWLAQVIRPGADTYLFTVVSEDWKVGTLQEQQGTGPNQLPDSAQLRDIYSLKSWSLSDVKDAISSGDASKAGELSAGAAAVRAPTALREVPEESTATFGTPGKSSTGEATPGRGEATDYRSPPKLPPQMSTMRMEDMLRVAMEAAAENPQHSKQFEEVLSRYKQHPGILRREAEARARERARLETFRPAYEGQRARIPETVTLQMSTIDEFVDAGCSWDLAEELVKFPILKVLRATRGQLEALPIFQTVQLNLDRRMSEEAARAVIYALPERFENDKWQVSSPTATSCALSSAPMHLACSRRSRFACGVG